MVHVVAHAPGRLDLVVCGCREGKGRGEPAALFAFPDARPPYRAARGALWEALSLWDFWLGYGDALFSTGWNGCLHEEPPRAIATPQPPLPWYGMWLGLGESLMNISV